MELLSLRVIVVTPSRWDVLVCALGEMIGLFSVARFWVYAAGSLKIMQCRTEKDSDPKCAKVTLV
jgi:hypothetical protein